MIRIFSPLQLSPPPPPPPGARGVIRLTGLRFGRRAPPRRFVRLGGSSSSIPSWLRPSFHGLAQLGGLGEVTQQTLRGAFDDSIAKVREKFAAATTNAAHYKAIAPYLGITVRNLGWVKDGTVSVTASQRAELEGIEARLRTLRNAAKVRYANNPNDAPPDRAAAVQAVIDSINWVARITGGALASSEAKATLVKNLAHKLTPTGILEEAGGILKTAVNQAAGALHVPTWLIPVGLGAVGLVLLVNLAGGVRALRGAAQ